MSSLITTPLGEPTDSRTKRFVKVARWIVIIAVIWLILGFLGVDLKGWISDLWDQISAIWHANPAYFIGALVLQSGQTIFAGLSYYFILKAAYREEVRFWAVVTSYAVGVAMNGWLPANIGTFVTLFMFVAIIPSCTLAGALAAYMVQKIFFTIAGTFVYLYLFLSVPGSFTESFGNLTSHWVLTVIIIGAIGLGLVALARALKKRLAGMWENAKEGGVILSTPRRYMSHVFLPSFVSYLCKLGVVAIFLGAFAIPVTFESIMWVVGSGSLANVASFTPGRGRRDPGHERPRAEHVLRRRERRRDRLLDRAAADHDGVEPAARDRDAALGLRLERRQAARRRLLHGREDEGGGDEGGAPPQEGGEAGREGAGEAEGE